MGKYELELLKFSLEGGAYTRYNMDSASKRGTGKIRARTPPSSHRAPSVGGWEDQSDESTQFCFEKRDPNAAIAINGESRRRSSPF